jgi:hypothetical protein
VLPILWKKNTTKSRAKIATGKEKIPAAVGGDFIKESVR